jgi:hypothetical protein
VQNYARQKTGCPIGSIFRNSYSVAPYSEEIIQEICGIRWREESDLNSLAEKNRGRELKGIPSKTYSPLHITEARLRLLWDACLKPPFEWLLPPQTALAALNNSLHGRYALLT